MKRTAHILTILAVLIAALLYAEVTGRAMMASAAGVIALVAIVRQPRTLSTPAQALLLIGSGFVAFLALGMFPDTRGRADRALADSYAVISGGALLLASLRTHIAEPEWGTLGTLGMGLLVFLACGSVVSGPIYLPLLVAYVLVALVTLRLADRGRASWSELRARDWVALAMVGVITTVGTSGFLVGLPALYDRANAWLFQYVGGGVRSGFDEGPIALGSMEGLLQSDNVVMRVTGRMDLPLRGRVYTRYANGFWMPEKVRAERRVASFPERARASEVTPTEVRYATEDYEIFFLPANASWVSLEPVDATVDEFGVVRPGEEERPKRIRLGVGGAPRFPSSDPGERDLQIPPDAAATLGALAREWIGSTESSADRLRAIEARLEAEYAYALEFDRKSSAEEGIDPVIDFLTREKRGHCEYFASALALLSRASGIPARVVTGYRVTERNPWSDYFVVRERHAHAWVEAYVDGAWLTFDPSPLRSLESEAFEMAAIPAFFDWVAYAWQRDGRTVLLIALVIFFVALQIRNLVRGRSPARHRSPLDPTDPPEYIDALLARLGRAGAMHRRSESIESYAERLPVESVPRELLYRYAAHRYGGLGDAVALESDVKRWLREDRRRP